MTTDPDAPSSIPGATTLNMLMRDQPTTFETVATSPEDTAVILYTSGTTGKPKGAELTHLNMLLNARLSDTMYPRADHDVHLITLPLFHSFGQTVQMNAGIYNRATLVLLPRFSPDAALHLMDEENITIFAGVPTMYWTLLHYSRADQYDLQKIARNLRVTISGGAAMPVEVMRAFNEKFNVKILEGYGLSETSPIAVFNRLDREARPGSIGFPVWGVEVRLVEAEYGRLQVSPSHRVPDGVAHDGHGQSVEERTALVTASIHTANDASASTASRSGGARRKKGRRQRQDGEAKNNEEEVGPGSGREAHHRGDVGGP